MRLFLLLIFSSLSITAHSREECPTGEHWVEPHYRRAYTRHDGVHVRATHVRGHCRVNPKGYDQWHQKLSNERPKIWGYRSEKSKKWTTEEVELLYDAISVLPEKLIHIEDVKIYRMDQSKLEGNPATSNAGDIALYDLAFDHKDSLAQILAHELAHVIYDSLSDKDKNGFKQAAGWIRDKSNSSTHVPSEDKVFIQPDSSSSISEDFANHLEHYLFRNEPLKEQSPKAYEWIKGKFGNNFKVEGVNQK